MKAVILAGGMGSRLGEETHLRPKPMVEIGGHPILWHIMKIYSAHGIHDFIVCLGYKGYVIKEYFANYFLHKCDVTLDMTQNAMEVHHRHVEPWRITLVDTGKNAKTGTRIRLVTEYLDNSDFCLTYGDGLSDVNIRQLITTHQNEQCLVTVTAVKPPGRYGALDIDRRRVRRFQEKPRGDNAWINGGFFVVSPEAMAYIPDADVFWEAEPLEKLAADGQLHAFQHEGFWYAMDTLRDKNHLEAMWAGGNAPWKIWKPES